MLVSSKYNDDDNKGNDDVNEDVESIMIDLLADVVQ